MGGGGGLITFGKYMTIFLSIFIYKFFFILFL